jgi:hypothetical protein
MIVDIYKFRFQRELNIYILMPTTSLEHPPICKFENQLYWCISILSVMGKYEMWGHLHPSLHKLQTKTIVTYCYQQRLFRIWDLLIDNNHVQWKLMDDYVHKLMTSMCSNNLVIFAEISHLESWRENTLGKVKFKSWAMTPIDTTNQPKN